MDNKLLDAIGNIDEELLPEPGKAIAGKKRSRKWIPAVAAAACLMIGATVAGYIYLNNNPNDAAKNEEGTEAGDNTAFEGPMLLAAPVYPLAVRPEEKQKEQLQLYETQRAKVAELMESYQDAMSGSSESFNRFYFNTAGVFLNDAGNSNRIYSPASFYLAVGMCARLAGGESRQQILDALCAESIEELGRSAGDLCLANYMDTGVTKCSFANSLWMNDKLSYKQETLDDLARDYYTASFTGNVSDERYAQMLRDWLNENTGGKLADSIENVKFDELMLIDILSTIDFQAKFLDSFTEPEIVPGIFDTGKGEEEVVYLSDERNLPYIEGENFRGISLDLMGGAQLRLLLPNEGVAPEELFGDPEAGEFLTVHPQNICADGYATKEKVRLLFPRFDITSDIDMVSGMKECGMRNIFEPEASDFTPLTDLPNCYVSSAHQTMRVQVSEWGCKATGYTEIMIYCGEGLPDQMKEFYANRPFAFEIISCTGTPLFAGVVYSPGKF